jgi:HD-GYP domain-containing protein (c-di-GMP phosphodiesterase class II)
MHLVAFEGSWFDHPFWRRHFILTADDIAQIRDAAIEAVIIDDAKGRRPEPQDTPARAAPQAPTTRAPLRVFPAYRQAADEVALATETVERSKRAIKRMFMEARLGRAITVEQAQPVVEEIAEAVERDVGAMLGVIRLKKKNEYTYLHSVAVCALMINLARGMDLPAARVRDIGIAGLLHDIGKMVVPDSVLNKPGPLDDREFAVIKGHPAAGHRLLSNSPSFATAALDVCLHHHERMDGRGYPFGLKGDAISLEARMGAVCDVYDAITSTRSYKDAWSPTMAVTRMYGWKGHFDPDILDAFARSIGIYPLGGLVRLRTGRLAVVVAEDERAPTRPRVRVFQSARDKAFTPFDDFAVADTLSGDGIVAIERGADLFGTAWIAMLPALMAGDEAGFRAAAASGSGRQALSA